MSKFPDPIRLPERVYNKRIERKKEIIISAIKGVSVRFGIILFELAGVWLFGSAALLMDAISSLADVAFSLILIFSIRLAAKPPDKNHPFGHGRLEPLVGLQLGIFLCLIGGGMLLEQFFSVTHETPSHHINPYTWIIPFCALILLEICYHVVMRTAKRENSPALAADALHYRIDGLTTLFATIALIIAAYIPEWSAIIDHVGAMLIAVFMLIVGFIASRKNLHQLVDRVPDAEYFEKVRLSARKVKGVFDTEKINIQLCGPNAHVDIDIEVDPHLTVEEAHKISQQVRVEIQKSWPIVQDVTVHLEPYYPNDH